MPRGSRFVHRGIGTVLLCALAVGCAPLMRVRTDEGETNVKGIPFFLKTERCKQVTVREQSWFDVRLVSIEPRLQKASGDGTGKVSFDLTRVEQPLAQATTDMSGLTAIRQYWNQFLSKGDDAALKDLVDQIGRLDKPDKTAPLPASGIDSLPWTTDEIVREVVVDYGKKYYLNASLPWFGTGSLNSKLGADGTLTEVAAAGETKAAEAIASLTPLKEWLSAKLIPSDDEKKQTVTFATKVGVTPDLLEREVVLRVNQVGFRYVLSKAIAGCDPKNRTGVLTTGTGVDVVRMPLEAPAKTEEKPPDNAIKVGGVIELPKPK